MSELSVQRSGSILAVELTGDGPAVLLLHGLTATRRYVVMGSKALQRSGHRVIAPDARGHGHSEPADAYDYSALAGDVVAVLDAAEIERAVLAGSSMGAHTLLRVALDAPDRVAGAVIITPAHLPGEERDTERIARWDALAHGLRTGGVDGFMAAYGQPRVPERMRETVLTVMRQRLSQHAHPEAVADAIEAVPRSAPFDRLEDLRQIAVPVTVIASSDAADPGHPASVGEAYARALPDAVLLRDEPGRSPRAWQGSQVSRAIADVVVRAREHSAFGQ